VPFFDRPHLVRHPAGIVTERGGSAHAAVTILLLHYLLHADGTPPACDWLAFRELPDGLFYASTFAARAEEPLVRAFGGSDDLRSGEGLEGFRSAASAAGGSSVDLADAAYVFRAFPRVRVAALLWAGDADFPAEARVVFESTAGHYLPTEDLAGLGGLLSHRLTGGLS
jgi:hypothetical protein